MKLSAWSQTDTGRRRAHNEDSLLSAPDLGLFAVADGMGGHKGGAKASKLALDVIHEEVESGRVDPATALSRLVDESKRRFFGAELANDGEDTQELSNTHPAVLGRMDTVDGSDLVGADAPAASVLRLAARKASAAVFAESLSDTELRGMGTTLTALMYDAGRMHLVHVGDSRAFLLRDGKLEQLTDDHSWIGEQVRAGLMTEAEAKISQFKHVITRSIGFEQDVYVDRRAMVVESGDCYLLCSDGLSNYVENDELERLMVRTWYRRLPGRLVELANARGGDDNITVVVVYTGNSR